MRRCPKCGRPVPDPEHVYCSVTCAARAAYPELVDGRTLFVFVGRPSALGNPYRVTPQGGKAEAVRQYREYLSTRPDQRTLHYGDPPCTPPCCFVGETMNSVPLRVLEYWHRPIVGSEGFRWRRNPELEVDIVPEWWREVEDG